MGSLTESPVLLLFVVLAIGTVIGQVRLLGVSIGPAAVLFAALAISAYNARLALPEVLGTFGLAVFAYGVGVTSGSSFFASLRRGLGPVLTVFAVLVGAALLAIGIGAVLGLRPGTIAGMYAGATTNTPALAAAVERLGGSADPTVGYSITYIFGVIFMLVAAAWALRRGESNPTPDDQARPAKLMNVTVRVTRSDLPSLGELAERERDRLLFSRVKTGDRVTVASEEMVLRPGDLVGVIGADDVVRPFSRWLGYPSSEHLALDRRELDFRRIVVSNKSLCGKTINELGLTPRFGATATRVRRGEIDLLATDDLTLQLGDRVRVTAPRARMGEVAKFLGDSEQATSDINPVGFALGMALGLLLGAIQVPLPGGGALTLGSAAGPLVAGLILGRVGRTGPIVWTMPHGATQSLGQLGMLVFLAYAGGRSGSAFVHAIQSPLGLKLLAGGALVTAAQAVALVFVGRKVLQLAGSRLAGVIGGAQTQPAVLAFANDRTRFDQRVALGYAMVYPIAMVVKILAAQLIAGM